MALLVADRLGCAVGVLEELHVAACECATAFHQILAWGMLVVLACQQRMLTSRSGPGLRIR